MRERLLHPVVAALGGIVLAVLGSQHPSPLGPDTAHDWWVLHVWLLPAFPLLAVGVWVLYRGRRDPVAWAVLVLGYVYATFYSALDLLAGVGAGYVTEQDGTDVRPDAVNALFAKATDLGDVGVRAFLVLAVLVTLDQTWRYGPWSLLPGLVLVGGAYSFLDSHVYPPRGVWTMLAIGLACGALALVQGWRPQVRGRGRRRDPESSSADPR